MVSIILVNYNGYKDTIECIESLSLCNYRDFEVILVDNASTDNSGASLKDKYSDNSKVTYIESKENNGFAAGNNLGIEYALKQGTDYVLLLNNDTLVEPDFLDKLMKGIAKEVNCGLAIGKILYEAERDKIWYAGGSLSSITGRNSHYRYNMSDDNSSGIPEHVTYATGCMMLIPRRTLEDVGMLSEEYFMYEEDADYCVKVRKAGYDIVYVPDSRIYHKVSSSASNLGDMQQYYIVRNKFIMLRENYKLPVRWLAYFICNCQYIKRCITKEISFKNFVNAKKAFIRGERGKKRML